MLCFRYVISVDLLDLLGCVIKFRLFRYSFNVSHSFGFYIIDTDTLLLLTHRNDKHPEALGFSSFGSPSGPGKSTGKGWKTRGKRWKMPVLKFPNANDQEPVLAKLLQAMGKPRKKFSGHWTLPTLRRNLGKSCEFGAEIEALKGSYGQVKSEYSMACHRAIQGSYVQVSLQYIWQRFIHCLQAIL